MRGGYGKMNGKERLEEINNFSSLPLKKRISLTKESIKKELKANDYHMPKNININTQYLLEIIEQAERVQELEEVIADYAYEIGKRKRALNKKNERNKRYHEALKNIYELAEYDEYDNTLEQIVSEIEKALEGEE